jgi:diphthamide synthase subunit DPH2
MRITLCSSLSFYPKFEELSEELMRRGHEVLRPDSDETVKTGALLVNLFPKIEHSDAVLVCNYRKHGVDGYIGGNTLIEIAHAYYHNKQVFLLNPVPDVSYRDEIEAVSPIVVGEDLAKFPGQA